MASPPQLSSPVQKLEDVDPPTAKWNEIDLPTDVVLLTVKNEEFLACYSYLKDVAKAYHNDLPCVYVGSLGDGEEKVKTCLLRCSQGSSNPGAAHAVVQNSVRILKPKAVVCVGYCGGLNPQKIKLGDVVISSKLAMYANTKSTTSGVEVRRTVPIISRRMRYLIMCAEDGWKAPVLKRDGCSDEEKPRVHCDGVLLSGPELVADPNRRKELLRLFPEAIAIEMEGEGVYGACHDLGVEWAIIKGVSDYADNTKKSTENWKPFASMMAASVVSHMFREPEVLRNLPHYSDTHEQPTNSSVPCNKVVAQTVYQQAIEQNPLNNLIQSIFVGDSGKTVYKGRQVTYKVKGRFHTVIEYVFDAEARDVATNTSYSKNHFASREEAIQAVLDGLMEKLKNEGKL